MKNNKYAPYILGPILLIVWGLIFYKIYQAVYGSEEPFTVPQYASIPVFEGPAKDSSFALLLDYKDPFFGKHFSSSKRTKSSGQSTPRTSKPKQTKPKKITPAAPLPAPSKPFPPIRYQGFQIMETDTVAAIKINNRFIPIARINQVHQGVQVLGIYPDSIRLQFDGQQGTFARAVR